MQSVNQCKLSERTLRTIYQSNNISMWGTYHGTFSKDPVTYSCWKGGKRPWPTFNNKMLVFEYKCKPVLKKVKMDGINISELCHHYIKMFTQIFTC